MREHQQVPEGRKADGNKMDGEKRTEDRGKSKQEETNKRKALKTQNGSAGRGTERGQWKKTKEKKGKGGGEGAKLDHNWVFMQKVVLVFCAIKVEKQITWNLRKYKL